MASPQCLREEGPLNGCAVHHRRALCCDSGGQLTDRVTSVEVRKKLNAYSVTVQWPYIS